MAAAVGSLTECSICMDDLSNPRSLPCHHTFCCECIANLRLSHTRVNVPCPLCRVPFSALAADLRTDIYAEELVRVSRDTRARELRESQMKDEVEAVTMQLKQTEDELLATKTDLEETKNACEEAVAEKHRLNTELAENRIQLTELENHSSQVEQQLESRLEQLDRNMTAAETREFCLHKQQRETLEQLKNAERRHEAAKIEVQTCRRAREDAEACKTKAKQSCQRLRQQLEQTERETSERLKDAERRQEEAKTEAETCQRAKNGIESSLTETKNSYRKLKQQQQQIQLENSKQTMMLEMELGESKKEVISLTEQLATERLKLVNQQDDYKKSHSEVVRLCLVLLALLAVSVTGALVLLEDRSTANVDAKEAQWIACNKLLAQKSEENAAKVTAARYEAREMKRLLNDCSDQLAATKQTLHTAEKKLKDSSEVRNGTEYTREKIGEPVKATLDSAIKEDSDCVRQLMEASANLQHQKMTLENCSSHLVQVHKDELTATATAKECSVHVKWLQQRLEEYMQGEAEKDGLGKLGCNCGRRSKESENVTNAFRTTEYRCDNNKEPVETGVNSDSANEQGGNCISQLTEARANLKTQEMRLRNCSSNLTQERKDKLSAAATAEECARQLNQSQHRLKVKTATLNQCQNQLKEAHKNATTISSALEQCGKDLISRQKVEQAGRKERSTKMKGESAKLANCTEKLTTALDTVRWNTEQKNRCAESLVKARGEVQSLTTRLSETRTTIENLKLRQRDKLQDTRSDYETVINNLKLRQQENLETIISNLQLRHEEEMEQAALLVPIYKSTFVVFLLFIYPCCIVTIYNLLAPTYYAHRFQNFIGIRGRHVLYRVNFRRPRYR